MDSEDGAVEANFEALLAVLRTNARAWNVDPSRVAVFACSSNVSAGLPLIANPRHEAVKAAVIYYGSANVQEFRRDVPMLVVRAGLDFPGLNRGIDGVVTRALAANVPLTVIGLNGAHHAFDLVDDNDDSRAAIAAHRPDRAAREAVARGGRRGGAVRAGLAGCCGALWRAGRG
jgi:dienelactone hydrolase